MMNAEKYEKIFTEEFVEANANIDNIDAIYEKAHEIDSTVTKDELVEYLSAVSDVMHQDELSDSDLDNVAGGIGLLAIGAAITAVAGVFGATYAAGTAIGRTIYNIRNW